MVCSFHVASDQSIHAVSMRIAHLNTYDTKGGAARAAFRLHAGLRATGHESHLVVCQKQTSDLHTVLVKATIADQSDYLLQNHLSKGLAPPTLPTLAGNNSPEMGSFYHLAAIQNQYINNNRPAQANILFSLPYPGIDVTPLPVVQAADIIHLHWMADFQSPITLNALFQLRKPVVWTLHDMWPFTGGCHSSGHCTGYQSGCHACPQLAHDPVGLPAAVLQDKRQLLLASNLTLIAPSQKMASLIRQSQLFNRSRVEVIHHSIDTNAFRPIDKRTAQQTLGIAPEARVIAFGSEDGQQRSKGMVELIEVMRLCQQDARFRAMVENKALYFMCCGDSHPDIERLKLPLLGLGVIHDDARLRQFYSAADVFLQPSLEESFGNMAIESLCCGTPVIGFDVGIAPEAIAPDQMGRVVPLGNIQAMADAVLDFVYHPEKWQAMGETCHVRATEQFSQHQQAQRVLGLYQDLLGKNAMPTGLLKKTISGSQPEPQAESQPNPEATLAWDCTLGPTTQAVVKSVVLGCVSLQLQEVEETLAHREERLRVLRDRIQTLKQQIHTKNDDLQAMQQALAEKDAKIEAMKTSKFWQLRTVWIKVRSRLAKLKP